MDLCNQPCLAGWLVGAHVHVLTSYVVVIEGKQRFGNYIL